MFGKKKADKQQADSGKPILSHEQEEEDFEQTLQMSPEITMALNAQDLLDETPDLFDTTLEIDKHKGESGPRK